MPNCPNPQITIWAQFGALRCDLDCNLGHNLSHDLGVIWATVNAPIANLLLISLLTWIGSPCQGQCCIKNTSSYQYLVFEAAT